MLSIALAPAALADAYQSGRTTVTATDLNGIYGYLEPATAFHPNSGACIVQSILLNDGATSRQMELGLARCSNATIDGTCNSGYTFDEGWYGGNDYVCYQHQSFNTGDKIIFKIERANSTIGTMNGTIGQTSVQVVSGFNSGTGVRGYAWAENTNTTTCGNYGPYTMNFNNIEKKRGSTWSYLTGSGVQDNNGCSTIGPLSSTGTFYVQK